MGHESKEDDTFRSMNIIETDPITREFEEMVRVEENELGCNLRLRKGIWKVKNGDFEKIFIATNEKPITFRRIDA